jgi:hypothetical protein
VDVPGDGTPGEDPPTIEHVVTAVSGIRAVDWVPPLGDYVAYDGASFDLGAAIACDSIARVRFTACRNGACLEVG